MKVRQDEDTHWWESYIIRYSIGTFVGALCVYYLAWRIYCGIHQIPMETASLTTLNYYRNAFNQAFFFATNGTFGIVQGLTLLAYGAMFCYVSGAPGLVLHAMRRFIYRDSMWCCRLRKGAAGTIYGLLIVGPICLYFGDVAWLQIGFIVVMVCFVLILLTGPVLECIRKPADNDCPTLLTFYRNLKSGRDSCIIDASSYKHLREHGSAFLLILCELILTALIVSVFSLRNSLIDVFFLMICWLLPGATVYFIGTKIEYQMVMAGRPTPHKCIAPARPGRTPRH